MSEPRSPVPASAPASAFVAVPTPVRREIATPYAAEARFRNSQHLDGDSTIGKLIVENRHHFENFVSALSTYSQEHGCPDSPEFTLAVRYLEIAKDAMGRHLIHGIGKRNGIPFETAVKNSIKSFAEIEEQNQIRAAQAEVAKQSSSAVHKRTEME